MQAMTPEKIQAIIEAALMIAGEPLSIASLQQLFAEYERPQTSEIKTMLNNIASHYQESGIELLEVASGYRLQAKAELSPWLSKLWEERTPRYSRALLETLAIIAYKQPITRAEIETIRSVTVSGHIIKALLERDWIRIVSYREIPGRPALYGTTKIFLDYFNLKSLSHLPPLTELKDLALQESQLQVQLALENSSLQSDDALISESDNEVESFIEISEVKEEKVG